MAGRRVKLPPWLDLERLADADRSNDWRSDAACRDVPEGEYAVDLVDGVGWELDGLSLEEAARTARERQAVAGLGERAAEVIAFVSRHPAGVAPAAVATALGLDGATARVYLARAFAAGRLERPKQGLYTPVAPVAGVTPAQPDATGATGATPTLDGMEP